MKELLLSLIEILAGLCFEINNRSDTRTLKRKQMQKNREGKRIGCCNRTVCDAASSLGNMQERQTEKKVYLPKRAHGTT